MFFESLKPGLRCSESQNEKFVHTLMCKRSQELEDRGS
jgi:hypothetical protein